MSSPVRPLPRPAQPRRALAGRPTDTVGSLLEAAVAEVADSGFDGLTVRAVARRAGLSPATAYSYFRSKEHLLTEVYWQRLAAAPEPPRDARRSPGQRVRAAAEVICRLVADEPELAAAVTTSLLAHDPDVTSLRTRIGVTFTARLSDALGADTDPAVLRVLVNTLFGALISAGTGATRYDDVPPLLAEATTLMTRRRR